jgi:hypothetical protein
MEDAMLKNISSRANSSKTDMTGHCLNGALNLCLFNSLWRVLFTLSDVANPSRNTYSFKR